MPSSLPLFSFVPFLRISLSLSFFLSLSLSFFLSLSLSLCLSLSLTLSLSLSLYLSNSLSFFLSLSLSLSFSLSLCPSISIPSNLLVLSHHLSFLNFIITTVPLPLMFLFPNFCLTFSLSFYLLSPHFFMYMQ